MIKLNECDTDRLEHFEHPPGADTARRALAAGLVLGEAEVELGHRGHTVLIGENDHTAGTHHRTDAHQRTVVDRGVEVFLGDAAAGGAARLHRLELASADDAAADLEDDLAERRAHRDFDQTHVVDLTGQREDLGAGVAADGLDPVAVLVAFGLPVADLGVPLGALAQDDRNRGVGFDVVDVGRAAPVAAADVRRERRFGGGLAALAFHRVDERGLLAADERARAELDLDVEREVRAEDVLAQESIVVMNLEVVIN